MYETINEKVDVAVVFGKGFRSVKPFRFIWDDKEYSITKMGYVHRKQAGKDTIHVFSVTDGSNFFELEFNPHQLSWLLGRVWDGEAN